MSVEKYVKLFTGRSVPSDLDINHTNFQDGYSEVLEEHKSTRGWKEISTEPFQRLYCTMLNEAENDKKMDYKNKKSIDTMVDEYETDKENERLRMELEKEKLLMAREKN